MVCLVAAFNPIECMTVLPEMHRSTTAIERNALRLHLAYSVCKDFPIESSCIGWGGPVEGGMAVVRGWLRARW